MDDPRDRARKAAGEIRSDLNALSIDSHLHKPERFAERAEALDHIEFHILERIEGLPPDGDPVARTELLELKLAAEALRHRLEKLDEDLFRALRAEIRSGFAGTRLKQHILAHASGAGAAAGFGYDALDAFTNGLLAAGPVPMQTLPLEPGMVFYQKTPARIVFDLVEKACFTDADVFFDLGSGLGQVPMLVNLIAGIEARGIEFEPAYCAYARACAAGLGLGGVEFLQEDARTADYSRATVLFLYTPFEGAMLRQVLDKVRRDSQGRRIRLFTYGPCTPAVAETGWLMRIDRNGDRADRLGEFASL